MPDDWLVQVYDAMVEVQKWCLTFDTIVLPWSWRDAWATLAKQTDWPEASNLLMGVDVRFAMIDKPVAVVSKQLQGIT